MFWKSLKISMNKRVVGFILNLVASFRLIIGFPIVLLGVLGIIISIFTNSFIFVILSIIAVWIGAKIVGPLVPEDFPDPHSSH